MTETRTQIPNTTDWLTATVKALVDDAGAVRVEAVSSSQVTILEVEVDPPDLRRVIGRQGRTATALRALLIAMGGRDGRKYHLELAEPDHRADEIVGDADLGVPVKVERRRGGRINLSVDHGD